MCIKLFFSFTRRRRRRNPNPPMIAEDEVIEIRTPILSSPRSASSHRPPKQRLRLSSYPVRTTQPPTDDEATPKSAISLNFLFNRGLASALSPNATPSGMTTAVNSREGSPNEVETFSDAITVDRPVTPATTEAGAAGVVRRVESMESLLRTASYRPSRSPLQSPLIHYRSLPSLPTKPPVVVLPVTSIPPIATTQPLPPQLSPTMPPMAMTGQQMVLASNPLSAVEQSPNRHQPSSPREPSTPATLRHSPSLPLTPRRRKSSDFTPLQSLSGKPHNMGFRTPDNVRKQRSSPRIMRRPKTAPNPQPIKPFAELQAELDNSRLGIALNNGLVGGEGPSRPYSVGEVVGPPIALPKLSPRPMTRFDGRASPSASVRTRLPPSRGSVRRDPGMLGSDLTG